MDEHESRPHDHLVEPLFAGLGHEPSAQRPRPGRWILGAVLVAALGGGLIYVLA